MRHDLIGGILTIVALLMLVGYGATAASQSRRLEAQLSVRAPTYERAQIQDRLTGTTLNVEPYAGGAARPALVWFLDLDRCYGCLTDVVDWLHLEQLPGHDLRMFVSGTPSPDVAAPLRLLKRTRIVYVRDEEIHRMIGDVLADTKLLIDDTGIIRLADSRASGQACGWSFEAQVAALLGLPPARPIRDTAP